MTHRCVAGPPAVCGCWRRPLLTLGPGATVILDNPKVAGVRQVIEAQGAQILYLPPYILDLNPIEPGFAKFKAALRKAAGRTSSRQTIGRTLDRYTPHAAYFASWLKVLKDDKHAIFTKPCLGQPFVIFGPR
jgi:transposase